MSVVVSMLVCLSLTGCGGSTNSPDASSQPIDTGLDDAPSQLPSLPTAGGRPEVLQHLVSESSLLVDIPELFNYTVMADSGLQVAYTDADLIEHAAAQEIESQWQAMQDCLGQTAAAPLVLVRPDLVEPFVADDLVLFYFLVPVASATMRTRTVLQISDSDFDGSLGPAGFYLRSIMGRFLWTAANLSVSDYPHQCASQIEAGI